MSNWIEPHSAQYMSESDRFEKFGEENLFPVHVVMKCMERRSKDMNVLPAFTELFDAFVRTIVPSPVPYILSLDGYASRIGTERFEKCKPSLFEAAKSPASNSPFLKACHKLANWNFQQTIQATRDRFRERTMAHMRSSQCNLV